MTLHFGRNSVPRLDRCYDSCWCQIKSPNLCFENRDAFRRDTRDRSHGPPARRALRHRWIWPRRLVPQLRSPPRSCRNFCPRPIKRFVGIRRVVRSARVRTEPIRRTERLISPIHGLHESQLQTTTTVSVDMDIDAGSVGEHRGADHAPRDRDVQHVSRLHLFRARTQHADFNVPAMIPDAVRIRSLVAITPNELVESGVPSRNRNIFVEHTGTFAAINEVRETEAIQCDSSGTAAVGKRHSWNHGPRQSRSFFEPLRPQFSEFQSPGCVCFWKFSEFF